MSVSITLHRTLAELRYAEDSIETVRVYLSDFDEVADNAAIVVVVVRDVLSAELVVIPVVEFEREPCFLKGFHGFEWRFPVRNEKECDLSSILTDDDRALVVVSADVKSHPPVLLPPVLRCFGWINCVRFGDEFRQKAVLVIRLDCPLNLSELVAPQNEDVFALVTHDVFPSLFVRSNFTHGEQENAVSVQVKQRSPYPQWVLAHSDTVRIFLLPAPFPIPHPPGPLGKTISP